MTTSGSRDVEEYVAGLAPQTRLVVDRMRDEVRAVLPGAVEVIRYGMPTFELDGRSIVHIGAWKRHVSMYPVPMGDADFEDAIAPFRTKRSTAQFPLPAGPPEGLAAAVAKVCVDRVE